MTILISSWPVRISEVAEILQIRGLLLIFIFALMELLFVVFSQVFVRLCVYYEFGYRQTCFDEVVIFQDQDVQECNAKKICGFIASCTTF